MIFRARQFEFRFPRPTLVMGIVNVTPDSFSDGGNFLDPEQAVAHGIELVAQGAVLLDVGGESTRPGATPVSEATELARVLPVIKQLAGRVRVPISIDTMKPTVARAALAAGASLVNDIAANRTDLPAQLDTAADRTILPDDLVRELALPRTGTVTVEGIGGNIFTMPLHRAELVLPGQVGMIIEVATTSNEPWILIGRDLLNTVRVVLDGPQ